MYSLYFHQNAPGKCFNAFYVIVIVYLFTLIKFCAFKHTENILEVWGVALEQEDFLRRNTEFWCFCDCLQ